MTLSSMTAQLQPLMGWLAVISLITFIVSLLLIPFVVRKMPTDIFINLEKRVKDKIHKSFQSYLILLLANLLAVLLILIGIIMLFIPGQGLLTILVGLLLLSFPGKKKVILNLIRRQQIQKSLDWIRTKQNKEPFLWPE